MGADAALSLLRERLPFDDETFDALEDLSDSNLGEMTRLQLTDWRIKAERELATAKNPKVTASAADLSALAAHFGRK